MNRSQIAGGILGLLVGDALGVPYEFNPPSALPPIEQIEMTPPKGFRRSHPRVPVGTWSDDGAQALALLASLIRCDGLDLDDLGRSFVEWYDHGTMTPDGVVFDVGIQTREAIDNLRCGASAEDAGPRGERKNGNGSLMRVLPLALWHRGNDRELVDDAMRQSRVTHGHLRSQLCCALYCLWARRVIEGSTDAWHDAVGTLREFFPYGCAERTELEEKVCPDDERRANGGGYVVDALHSARWAVGRGSYERVVKEAIALGEDTDTTACIAGGIAGVRDGVDAIPERWRTALQGMSIVTPMIDALVRRHELTASTHGTT
jgi:ADP-ribosyl-[dinitrogen reductase] hydrolase